MRILVQRHNWAVFFENEQEETGYLAILNEFLFTKIEGENIGNIWFQRDAAMCHTAEATLDVLRPVLEDRIIVRKAEVVWQISELQFDTVGLLFVGCRQI